MDIATQGGRCRGLRAAGTAMGLAAKGGKRDKAEVGQGGGFGA
jgi:hypothetical protein